MIVFTFVKNTVFIQVLSHQMGKYLISLIAVFEIIYDGKVLESFRKI